MTDYSGGKNAETCFIYKGLIWFVHGQNIWDETEEGNLKEAMYWFVRQQLDIKYRLNH